MPTQPLSHLISLTYVTYALHLFSAVTGVLSSAFVLTAFLTGWPSIIAVILNYVKRSQVQGTYLESHFNWQITTFWYALLWMVIASILMVTVILIPVSIGIIVFTGLWVLYRMIKGLLRVIDGRPV
jgi:uncharacterized membrane protein